MIAATVRTATAVPTGLVDSLTRTFQPELPADQRARRLRLTRLLANAALGTGVGLALGGPVGAVAGLGASIISSALSNVAEAQTGGVERFTEAVDAGVNQHQNRLKGVLAGTLNACRTEFRHGKISGAAYTAGMLAGVDAVRNRPREATENHHSLLGKAARGVTGTLGVAINLPGGIVAGSLHAMGDKSPAMRPLLMLCTGLGKALVPAVLGGIVAGPVGAAVASGLGVLVDVTVDGINTIIDGKKGINESIVNSIDEAFEEAIPEETDEPGYGVYYRQGQGAVIGGFTCLTEGWKRGYYGGAEAVRAMIESPVKATT